MKYSHFCVIENVFSLLLKIYTHQMQMRDNIFGSHSNWYPRNQVIHMRSINLDVLYLQKGVKLEDNFLCFPLPR